MSSHCLSSVSVYVLTSSSYKDDSHIGLGLAHMTSSDISYLFKGPVSHSDVLEAREVDRTTTYIGPIQPIAPVK